MRKLLIILIYTALTSLYLHAQSIIAKGKAIDPYHYTSIKQQTFTKGAVACAHPLASLVGAQILKQGGNAIDAAIAVQLALAVVYPGAGNIGGGGFMVAQMKNGKAFTLDFRETAPAKASRNMYLDASGNAQTTLSQNGHLASGVPGTVAGLFAMMRYAKLPLRTLIQPAIDLAENGFCITLKEANKMNSRLADFKKYNTKPNVFIRDKWKQGDTLIQKDLASTLKRIRDKGQAGFYEGETARLIVEEMQRGNGIITYEDLKAYKPKERTPLVFDYKGYKIVTMPPPSSGGFLLLQMLKMVEDRPLAYYGFETVKSVQLMTEVERRAFADRAEHLGDPDFWKVPLKTITSTAYIKNRMKDYDSTKASKSSDIKAGVVNESTETTHINVVDASGNMVAITYTLNGTFGSKVIVGGAGFVLNNEMDDFSIKPGVANMYGAVGGEANAIAPHKRMLSSMCPTLVLKNNQPFMAVGTPGGTTIPTSIFQMIVDLVDFKMQAADAVNKPRFHHQWLPDVIEYEANFPGNVLQQLMQKGYASRRYTIAGYEDVIGRVELIQFDKKKLKAVADVRGDDSVAGY